MENNNYQKPTFQSLLHQFEYDNHEYRVQVDKETGKFDFNIYQFEIGEGIEIKNYIDTIYTQTSDSYWAMKELFFTFHTLVVPFEVKEEAGFEDGSFQHPYKNLDKLFED